MGVCKKKRTGEIKVSKQGNPASKILKPPGCYLHNNCTLVLPHNRDLDPFFSPL